MMRLAVIRKEPNMTALASLWLLWLVLWLGGLASASYFQVQNMKKIQSFDIDGMKYTGVVASGLAALVGFVLLAISVVILIIDHAKG